jgi:hypothetical protein
MSPQLIRQFTAWEIASPEATPAILVPCISMYCLCMVYVLHVVYVLLGGKHKIAVDLPVVKPLWWSSLALPGTCASPSLGLGHFLPSGHFHPAGSAACS